MGLLLTADQFWINPEIFMARHTSVEPTVREVSISFHPMALPGNTALCTALKPGGTDRVRHLVLLPSGPALRCLEPPKAVDPSARSSAFRWVQSLASTTASAAGTRSSTPLASEKMVRNRSAEWSLIRLEISTELPAWAAPMGM